MIEYWISLRPMQIMQRLTVYRRPLERLHRQCRINNVAGVAHATGPALLGAQRFDNFIFFTQI